MVCKQRGIRKAIKQPMTIARNATNSATRSADTTLDSETSFYVEAVIFQFWFTLFPLPVDLELEIVNLRLGNI